MDASIVEATLIKVHQEIQSDCGHDPNAVKAGACPLRDLPGFDSLLIPVVFRRVARTIGITLPPDFKVPNIYVDPGGKRKLTIKEIAAGFCALLASTKAA